MKKRIKGGKSFWSDKPIQEGHPSFRGKYSVILADAKRIVIKHIGKADTLAGAEAIRNKRKIQPNQRIWIGLYVDGLLKESFHNSSTEKKKTLINRFRL